LADGKILREGAGSDRHGRVQEGSFETLMVTGLLFDWHFLDTNYGGHFMPSRRARRHPGGSNSFAVSGSATRTRTGTHDRRGPSSSSIGESRAARRLHIVNNLLGDRDELAEGHATTDTALVPRKKGGRADGPVIARDRGSHHPAVHDTRLRTVTASQESVRKARVRALIKGYRAAIPELFRCTR
jgi:hypothetical protein